MSYRRVSLLVATRLWPEGLQKLLDSYYATTSGEDDSEIVYRVDYDDPESIRLLSGRGWPGVVGPRGTGLSRRYNEMARLATGDILVCCNDHTIIETPGWPQLVIEAANRYPDGIFNIGISTELAEEAWAFPCVSRKLVQQLGFITDECLAYPDIFLLDIAKHFGRSIKLSTVSFRYDCTNLDHDSAPVDSQRLECKSLSVNSARAWTEQHRNLHDRVVAEAVSRIDPDNEIPAGQALLQFEAYQPSLGQSRTYWPPIVPALPWSAPAGAGGIQYHREEIFELFKCLLKLQLPRRRVLLTNFGNGLPMLLWGQIYDRVVCLHDANEASPIEEDKYRLEFVRFDNIPFIYGLLERIGQLDAVVLDSDYYARLIAPYFMLRRTMPHPSIIVIMNTGIQAAKSNITHPRRFVDDLCSGRLDGTLHQFSHIEILGGKGISYEIVGGPTSASGLHTQNIRSRPANVLELELLIQELVEKNNILTADLETQAQDLKTKAAASKAESDALLAQRKVLTAQIESILNSTSWRIMSPLRTISRVLNWIRRRIHVRHKNERA